jgi:Holliday junction DNA helicase RuvA
LSTYDKLGDPGSTVTLLTHLHVREDALLLYGFATHAERELFRLLVSVSGIGPKIAIGILSGIQSSDLQQSIAAGNVAGLTAIPGVGRKTAERIVLELRDKIGRIEESAAAGKQPGERAGIRGEALAALMSLGYNRNAAELALRSVLLELGESEYTIQELLKRALRAAAKQ